MADRKTNGRDRDAPGRQWHRLGIVVALVLAMACVYGIFTTHGSRVVPALGTLTWLCVATATAVVYRRRYSRSFRTVRRCRGSVAPTPSGPRPPTAPRGPRAGPGGVHRLQALTAPATLN